MKPDWGAKPLTLPAVILLIATRVQGLSSARMASTCGRGAAPVQGVRHTQLLANAVGHSSASGACLSNVPWAPQLLLHVNREVLRMQGDSDDGASKKASFGVTGGTATLEDSEFSVNTILKQLESIQQGTPKNIVILGTRHCSFLHQQIIELLSYALVLSDNHIYTSGATGTHAAAIRGALRAEFPDLLTVILPQTVGRQPREIRELLGQASLVSLRQSTAHVFSYH